MNLRPYSLRANSHWGWFLAGHGTHYTRNVEKFSVHPCLRSVPAVDWLMADTAGLPAGQGRASSRATGIRSVGLLRALPRQYQLLDGFVSSRYVLPRFFTKKFVLGFLVRLLQLQQTALRCSGKHSQRNNHTNAPPTAALALPWEGGNRVALSIIFVADKCSHPRVIYP